MMANCDVVQKSIMNKVVQLLVEDSDRLAAKNKLLEDALREIEKYTCDESVLLKVDKVFVELEKMTTAKDFETIKKAFHLLAAVEDENSPYTIAKYGDVELRAVKLDDLLKGTPQ